MCVAGAGINPTLCILHARTVWIGPRAVFHVRLKVSSPLISIRRQSLKLKDPLTLVSDSSSNVHWYYCGFQTTRIGRRLLGYINGYCWIDRQSLVSECVCTVLLAIRGARTGPGAVPRAPSRPKTLSFSKDSASDFLAVWILGLVSVSGFGFIKDGIDPDWEVVENN